jgi:hypothetical protein|mmetsp:Transcript_40596/g.53246  ORF Transcript_40596/g.53246 Transcript_40596/m.53246 type:complete len:218 (+) Transcript_40596:393-1046(+)
MIKTMNEQKAKFLKPCDKNSLANVKKIVSSNQSRAAGTGREILDGICKFIKKDPNASFATDGQTIFMHPELFSKNIKECFPEDADKAWLQKMATSVNQPIGEGSVKGSLLKAVTEATTSSDMAPFFPYFKILYKLAQLGMTICKKTSLERQVAEKTKAMDDSQIEMEKQQAIVDNLSFYQRVQDEVNRASEEELYTLNFKSQDLRRKMSEYQQAYGD